MKELGSLGRYILSVFFLFSVTLLLGAPGKELRLTLEQAIGIALSDNPTIRVAEQDVELKKVSYKEAWQTLLPTVDLTGSINYTVKAATMSLNGNNFKMGRDATSTWNGALAVNLPLYAPTVYRTMSMSESDMALAVEKSRASRLDMVNQVTKAYFQILLAQDSYDVLLEGYAFSERNYEVVKAKYEQGSVSEYDKISAEVQMRNLKPGLVSARNALNISEVQMKVLLGISDAELHIVIDDSLKNYESAVSRQGIVRDVSLSANSTMKQLELNETLLQESIKMQRTGFFPTLSLSYQLQTQSLYNDNFRFWNYAWSPSSTLALTLSVPLFRASNFTKVKTARIQLEQLGENRINTERQLRMQLQTYQDNMQACTEQMESNKESVAQAEKGRMIAQKRYEVGKGTMLELNNSEVVLTQSQLAYHQAIYDYLVAKADLDYLLGEDVIQ